MTKKLLAILLVLTLALSLAACGEAKEKTNKDLKKYLAPVNPEIYEDEDNEDYVAPEINLEEIDSVEDFKNNLDKKYQIETTQGKDGSMVVILKNPIKEEDGIKPAIPTIDKTIADVDKKENEQNLPVKDETTPSAPEKTEPIPEPEETPEIEEKPEPDVTPEPTPEPEIIPEPEVNPAPQEPKPQYTYTTGQTHKSVPVTQRYLYSLLTEEYQKKAYLAIDNAVKNMKVSVDISYDLSKNREYYIYYMYLFDNPEHFYLANSCAILSKSDGTSRLTFYYAVGKAKGEHNAYSMEPLNEELKAKVLAKKAIFDAEVKRITSTIPSNAPDVVKEKLIYDRILIDSFYNLSAKWDGLADDNWTAYGILVNKYGVCESYSEAFQTLCLAVGINCTGVVGSAGGGHKWNAVELEGEWYMCDITFDDPIGNDPDDAYHFYFNRTSKEMTELKHDWSNSDYPVPQCNGTKYAYNAYFN